MQQSKTAGTLGLCRRAGSLVQGFDAVRRALESGEAHLIVLADGLSEKTAKEIRFFAGKAEVPLLQIGDSMDDLAGRFGRRTGVFAVTDEQLARAVSKSAEAGERSEGGNEL